MAAQDQLLALIGISQRYRTGDRVFTAIHDVNLSLNVGQFMCLLGPSGCGKSSLLRIITGLQQPTDGQVLYRGQALRGVNQHATIVFQTFALFPWLTVLDNVEVALKSRGVPAAQRTPRAVELLDQVGLDGFESAYPRELSGGMRQKVGFARAMAVEPELLCLDEPFSALDILSAEALRNELVELWTSGNIPTRAILMVTHNIEEAIFLADRIVVMDKEPGRVVAELHVDLPHPRNRKSATFLELVDRVYATLAGRTRSESEELGTAPGEPGRTRALPAVSVNDLTGLLERLADSPNNREDIYQLTDSLGLNSDQVLSLTEAVELLGFATVAEGDITANALGETFAEASITARKEIFATRMRRLPIVKWLTGMLRAAEGQRLEWDVVQKALELEFPPEIAAQQLENVINWSRYAEIIAYDDASEMLYLEASIPPAPGSGKQRPA